jgi:hypothetical protein
MTPNPARDMAAGTPTLAHGARTWRWPKGMGRGVNRVATRANVERDTRSYPPAASERHDIVMRRFLASRRYLEKKDLRRGYAEQSGTTFQFVC